MLIKQITIVNLYKKKNSCILLILNYFFYFSSLRPVAGKGWLSLVLENRIWQWKARIFLYTVLSFPCIRCRRPVLAYGTDMYLLQQIREKKMEHVLMITH